MPGRVRLVCAATVGLALVAAACDSQVVTGRPAPAARGQHRSVPAHSTESRGLAAFCAAMHRGAHAITRSNGDLHVVLHSFERMNAVAPAVVSPDTGYVVEAIRHALATHQMPDLTALGTHTHAVARWGAAHCDHI